MVTRTRTGTAAPPRKKRVRRRRPRQKRLQKRWLILSAPFGIFAALVALAPATPQPDALSTLKEQASGDSLGAFRYQYITRPFIETAMRCPKKKT